MEVFYGILERGETLNKVIYRLNLTKNAQFRLICHPTQSEPNAGDLNEREWILRVGVGCVYPHVGIISLIRAHNRGIYLNSWSRTTAHSWPDPNWNNRWPGVVPRYFPINSPVPQRSVPVVLDGGNPVGAKPLPPVQPKTQVRRKRGRQSVV